MDISDHRHFPNRHSDPSIPKRASDSQNRPANGGARESLCKDHLYLDWIKLIDNKEENRDVETHLVKEGYMKDPDFDKWYPLSVIMSLISTSPPAPLAKLKIPTMFMVAERGVGGSSYVHYLEDLYGRLPPIKKRMVEVDGSVYWMLSHPREAAKVICDWFDETLKPSTQELAQPCGRASRDDSQ